MRVLVMLTCYLAAGLALVGAGLIGISVLNAPFESAVSETPRAKFVRKADRNPGEQQFTDTLPAGKGFRYGPEVNHGRSDAPVNHSQQALREARSAAPIDPRMQPYRERRAYQERQVADPAVRPSGH